MIATEKLEQFAKNKTKVRVVFASGRKKWGWVHRWTDNKWYLTRGNFVGFSLDTAIKIEAISE